MLPDDTKSIFQSRTMWGGGIALLAGAAQIVGYTVTPADTVEATGLITGLITSGAGLLTLVGRIRATKRVKL